MLKLRRGRRRRAVEKLPGQFRRRPGLAHVVVQIGDHPLQLGRQRLGQHHAQQVLFRGREFESGLQSRPAGVGGERRVRRGDLAGQGRSDRVVRVELAARGLFGGRIVQQPPDLAGGDRQALVGAAPPLAPAMLHPPRQAPRPHAHAGQDQIGGGDGLAHGASIHQEGGDSTPSTRTRMR